MRTVNKVILIGNITKDPYVKTTVGGKKVAMFTVATNRYFKSATGEPQNEAEYTNCITWGNLADRCEQFLVKGKLVYIEGHLKTRALDRDDGTKNFKTEVVVSNLIFLSKKEEFSEGGDAAIDDFDDLVDDIDDKF